MGIGHVFAVIEAMVLIINIFFCFRPVNEQKLRVTSEKTLYTVQKFLFDTTTSEGETCISFAGIFSVL